MPKFAAAIDLQLNELKNGRIHNLAAAPAVSDGLLYFNTVQHQLYVSANGVWVKLGGALLVSDIPVLTSAKISDFDTQVRTSRLDQMALPTSDVALNARKITGLASPTLATDAATKSYVDNAIQGLDAKDSVFVASTANIVLTDAGSTVDGVDIRSEGMRVLVKNQTDIRENGIYSVHMVGATTTLLRTSDADQTTKLTGAFVFVESGNTQYQSGWVCEPNSTSALGVCDVAWMQFSGAGEISVGNGMSKTGNTLDARVSSFGGLQIYGSGLAVKLNGTSLYVDESGLCVTQPLKKFYLTNTATTNPWVITHNLGTQDLVINLYKTATMTQVYADIVNTDVNTTTISFAVAPTVGLYRVVIMG